MPRPPRRTRVVLAMVVFVAALAAWQGAAVGLVTVTGATIDGVTSTSAPPGSVLRADVTADVSQGKWRGTTHSFAPGPGAQCVNTADKDPGTGRTVNFNVTAPGVPRDYNANFAGSHENDCASFGPSKLLADALRVTAPAPNQNLPPRCGINVMLVLDESGSINTSGQTETVRNATRAFLAALSGTGAQVSIVDFSTTAGRPVGYTTVTAATIASVFEPYLKTGYQPNGYTNWEAAFQKVREANTQGTLADLVVFVTDGDPTARNTATGTQTFLVAGTAAAMRPAAEQADLVKGQGSHVFALGVGAAVTNEASARRLTAVSGFDRYPDESFARADYTLVQDFNQLAQALRDIAIELCQASATVTKLVDEGDGTYRPDAGWAFTATVSTSPGGFTWLQPSTGTGPSRSDTTNDEGIATFQWKPANATATSNVTLSEGVEPGYEFVDAVCVKNAPGRTPRRSVRGTTPTVIVPELGPREYARCTVRNRIIPGTIEIEKSANPQTSQPFQFSGSGPLGDFTLVDDGKNDPASSRTVPGLAPGTYTVREIVPADWALSGVTCTPAAAAAIAGSEVTITLASGGSVVCTYRDTRIDPPVPPEPPTPPAPPTPPEPPPVDPFGVAELSVVKTAPRVARVGALVQFELTVRNVSDVTAQDVTLADVPPAALTLAELQSTGGARARLARGNAYWDLGTLAPGARRTVRGTVRIESGTPGLKRNHALATAVNANLARDDSDTRVLAQRRVIPPVTG
jgi:uncharacterized repeat protein (TIGR01451 family)